MTTVKPEKRAAQMLIREILRISKSGVILAACACMALAPSIGLGQFDPDDLFGGPPAPLLEFSRQIVKGDVYVEGAGLRNVGQATIDLTGDLPVNSVIKEAYLYWAVLRRGNEPLPDPAPRVSVNGTAVPSTYVASHGEPCWVTWDQIDPPFGLGQNFADVYRNDVTSLINEGVNTLSGFPSGLTDGTEPTQLPRVFPLMEGVSLVVIFEHAEYDCNEVALHEGAMTFTGITAPLAAELGSFTATSDPGNPIDDLAHTTFIVADGQDREFFGSVFASFNGTVLPIGGPAIDDAFPGADGANVSATDGIWDSRTDDVSPLFPLGATTAAVASIDNQLVDCHTWVAQVTSVKTKVITDRIKPRDDLSSLCLEQPIDGSLQGRGIFTDNGIEWNLHSGMKLLCQGGDNRLEIRWNPSGRGNGRGSNVFILETTTETACSDEEGVDSGQPLAPFDTLTGSGFGTLNGEPGAHIEFTFMDAGEPGEFVDYAAFIITPPGGGDPISASGFLEAGNMQAHP
jgi:hypothetical protein